MLSSERSVQNQRHVGVCSGAGVLASSPCWARPECRRHGAVVIPAEAVRRTADAADFKSRKEARIIEVAEADGFDIEKLKQAIRRSADIH